MSEQIKYEAVFGDQSLFDGCPEDAEAVFKSSYDDSKCFYYKLSGGHQRFFADGWIAVPSINSQTFNSMRRVIRVPVWSKADQLAGKLPEVGAKVCYLGIEYEVLATDKNSVCFLGIDKELYIASKSSCKPIETPEERAMRVREEWCVNAAKLLKNLEYSSTLTSIYDALLSGELKMPEVQK